MRTRAATYLRFLAVFAVLGTLGLASSAYLLIKQRAPNPFRDTYTIKAMFTEADGVIAGIGQPVNVAGVKVGQVTGARLADGKALVTMELRREQLPHVYADASAILDPITPLKDMQIALSPGRPPARALTDGATIAVDHTQTPVPLADLLSNLDADTRTFLSSLISSLDQGSGGRADDLRRALATFGPTAAQGGADRRAEWARTGLKLVELPEPEASHPLFPGSEVIVDVHAAGASFPELLQTRGMYQIKPPVPFVPGIEVSGIVRSAPDGAGVRPGDRVAAGCLLGGFAEVAVAPEFLTFKLPEALDFVQGAGLIVNYHTAYFALVTRGRLKAGETVLVHGAAGGVGTATLQVAKALRARTVAVVSDDEKERFAREAGADEVLRSTGPWRDEAKELSGGGVDVVIDPVGGERFTDSLRSLRRCGRLVAVGFSGGEIPAVKVNRLLLNNTEVVGAAWGEYALGDPDGAREIGREVNRLVDDGFVRPLIGQRFALDQAAEALKVIERRQALGKIVLDVR